MENYEKLQQVLHNFLDKKYKSTLDQLCNHTMDHSATQFHRGLIAAYEQIHNYMTTQIELINKDELEEYQ